MFVSGGFTCVAGGRFRKRFRKVPKGVSGWVSDGFPIGFRWVWLLSARVGNVGSGEGCGWVQIYGLEFGYSLFRCGMW